MRNTKATQLLLEMSKPGLRAVRLPKCDVPHATTGKITAGGQFRLRRRLCRLSEIDVIRHYTNLSTLNMSVDTHFYPLGSCTMKYNPSGTSAGGMPGSSICTPISPIGARACSNCFDSAQHMLAEIAGLPAVSLQPAAGAHGEMTALLVAAAYFRDRGEKRTKCLFPTAPTAPILPAQPWPA